MLIIGKLAREETMKKLVLYTITVACENLFDEEDLVEASSEISPIFEQLLQDADYNVISSVKGSFLQPPCLPDPSGDVGLHDNVHRVDLPSEVY